MNSKTGKIILKAVSNTDFPKSVLAYLLKISKSPSPDQPGRRFGSLPIMLFKNIGEVLTNRDRFAA